MKNRLLTDAELSTLCGELSLLIRSGVGAGDALSLLAEEEREKDLKELLSAMAREADCGEPLSAVMRQTGRFPLYVVGLVEVGERTGHLEEALRSLSRYYEERDRLDRQVRASLLYPCVLLLVMLVVIVVLLVRVLPVFEDVYASLGGQLTGVAGGLLALGRALDTAMPVLCAALGLVVIGLGAFAISGAFRARVLAWWHRRRGDKGVSRQMGDARFAQALAMGLRSGLPLEESLELSVTLLSDVPAAVRRCHDCQSRLAQGTGLAESLRDSGALPAAACRLLALGLRSGTGDTVMEEIARRLSLESQEALEAKVARVEPALVLVTSVLVGVILLSVMLPLMHIMTAIG